MGCRDAKAPGDAEQDDNHKQPNVLPHPGAVVIFAIGVARSEAWGYQEQNECHTQAEGTGQKQTKLIGEATRTTAGEKQQLNSATSTSVNSSGR